MNAKLTVLKNKVVANERKILLYSLATVTAVATLQQIGIRQHNQFLKDHDLYDEFYTPTDEEMGI